MTGRIILTDACVAEGAAWLATQEPRFAAALALTGPLPLRREADGFDRLLRAIMSQQISVASARAVSGRMEAAGLITPGAVLAATEDDLRACGLSRQKMRYAKALAAAEIDYVALRALPTDAPPWRVRYHRYGGEAGVGLAVRVSVIVLVGGTGLVLSRPF